MTDNSIFVPVLVASVTGGVSLIVLAINAYLTGSRERISRRREIFSKAFTAAVSYQEFPYVVRRRRTSSPEDERIRISTELRKVQEDISYHTAWLYTESQEVSDAYQNLIGELRLIAGNEIRKAWDDSPVDDDAGMNMPDLGLDRIEPLKMVFLVEVVNELSLTPRWLRRILRKSK